MATNFDSFDGSPVGNFIQSPLSERNGDGLQGKGDLVVCGNFALTSSVGLSIAVWDDDNDNWIPIGKFGGVVFDVISFKGVLYAGGGFNSVDGDVTINRMARYNNATGTWSACGADADIIENVYKFYSFDGQLVVGGSFSKGGGSLANGIMVYDPDADTFSADLFNDQGTPRAPSGDIVCDMIKYPNSSEGKLHYCDSGRWNDVTVPADVFEGIAKYDSEDDDEWVDVDDSIGAGSTGTLGSAIEIYEGQLIFGGLFSKMGSTPIDAQSLASWDGTTWTEFGGGLDEAKSVYTLETYNGSLIAGGTFSKVGGLTVERIAEWTGGGWVKMGTNPVRVDVRDLIRYKNRLMVAGNRDVQEWDGASWRNIGLIGTTRILGQRLTYGFAKHAF